MIYYKKASSIGIVLLVLVFAVLFASAATSKDSTLNLYETMSFSFSIGNNGELIPGRSINKIKGLLAAGADPNYINPDNNRSILKCLCGVAGEETEDFMIEVLELLVRYGLKIQWCDDAILFVPINEGYLRFIESLLKMGVDPNKPINGWSPVEIAAAAGQSETIKLLVKYGAKAISQRDALQIRLVQVVYNYKGNIDEIKRVIAQGAAWNINDKFGRSALVMALSSIYPPPEKFEVASYILENGADPNHRAIGLEYEFMGKVPPLFMAVMSSNIWLVPNRSYSQGINTKENQKYEKMTINELIKAGAFVSGRTEFGLTALHIAAFSNNLEAAKILIDAGAKIMPKDNWGKTPLDYAESAEMIKLLKDNGARE